MENEKKERVPLHEEILAEFAKFGGGEGKETRSKKDDEGGITVLEVSFAGAKEGEVTELSYCRKGGHGGDRSVVTTIEAVYYDADGMPSGGKTLANLVDGEWQYMK